MGSRVRRFPIDEAPDAADDPTDQRQGDTFEQGSDNIFVHSEEEGEPQEVAEQQSTHHSLAGKDVEPGMRWLHPMWSVYSLSRVPAEALPDAHEQGAGQAQYLCKSRVYDAVQEAAKLVPGLKREQVFAGVKTPALGGYLTSGKCKGEWLPLGITVDPISGLALTIDARPSEDIKVLKE